MQHSRDMDLFSPSLWTAFLLCTSLALITFFFSFFTNRHKSSAKGKLPPGKTGWPVLGETLDFLVQGRKGQPEKFPLDRKNRYSSDIFRTSLFGDNMVYFCGPTANKFLFSNENKLFATWWPDAFNKLFFSDSSLSRASITEKSKPFRASVLGFLKLDAIQNYIHAMDSMAKGHIEKEWAHNGVVLVHELVKKYTLELACQLLMGIEDHERLARVADRFVGLVAGTQCVPIDFPGTTFNKAIKEARFLRKELVGIIKDKKMSLEKEKDPTARDLMSYFLLTPGENGKIMNDVDIADKVMGLLIGGYDTASIALTFTIKYLAELPDVYAEVLKEVMEIAKSKGPEELLDWGDIQKMKYTWNVACEAMRLEPPAQMGFKEALKDFTFAGFNIPKGWKACWSVHSTHKDPKYFPDPEKFDPTRFEGSGPAPYTYVPFGGGPRMCPGKEYARLEILVFTYNLVKKFKWEKLIPNERTVFKPNPSPEKGLPIRLHHHQEIGF